MNNPIKTLTFPGDKSISHRLVLLSLLSEKAILINNLPEGKDVASSLNIVKKLGVEVCCSDEGRTVVLSPLKRKDFGKEEIVLDCGNSGTTARLLCGILTNLIGRFKLIGDESLSKRPMERVVRPLADLMGVNISSTDGHLPIYIESNGKTKAADFFNQTGSAQVKSAVLFAGLAAEGKTTVSENILSRDHTERLLQVLRHCESNEWQSSGQPACSTLFSSAVSENNCLRIGLEGTSLVRRIEGLASAVRSSKSSEDGGQPACSTLFSSAVSENNCLRIGLEGTSLVRRIEGLASTVRSSKSSEDGGQPACSTLSEEPPQKLCFGGGGFDEVKDGGGCNAKHCGNGSSRSKADGISEKSLNFCIPGDISSAAYFIVLSLITRKSLKIENVLLNPTRTGFLNVLKRMGADIEEQVKEDDWEPIGDLIVKGGELKATDITAEEIPSVIDELPILAIAMAFAEGKSRVSGASELRVKESDRISCLISQLKKVGINCSEFDDGYEIIGGNKIKSAELDSFGDHRLTMSFTVLARAAGADLKVIGRESAAVSFPRFYEYLF